MDEAGRNPRRAVLRVAAGLLSMFVAAWLLAFGTQAVPRTFVLDVGGSNDGDFITGFHKPEAVAGASSRWTAGTGRIRLGHVGDFPATVRIRWAGHPARNSDRIYVSAGGSEAVASGGPSWQILEIGVAGGRTDSGELTASIRSAETPSDEDGRNLGVLIDWIEVKTGGRAALQFPLTAHVGWMTLLFVGVMVGAATAVSMLGELGRLWPLAAAAAAAALAFVALVYSRPDMSHLVPAAAILACLAATFTSGVQHPLVRHRLEKVTLAMEGWRPRVIVFTVAAIGVLAVRFHEAFVRGWVLSGPDILHSLYPWRAYAPDGFVVPRNWILGDIPQFFYPAVVFAARAVRSGTLPLWNATIDAGQPFVAVFQSAVFSPFTALAYVVPLPRATVVVAMAVLLVSGLGMFVFVRSLGLGWPAATVAGIAYLVNPFSTAWLWPYPGSAVVAWIPWLLWGGERVVRRAGAADALLLAMLTSLPLFSGHPETAFKALLLAGAYGVFCWLWQSRRLQVLGLLVVGYGAGALLVAFQILPFAEYLSQSRVLAARQAFGGNPFFAPVATLITIIVPNFLGHPAVGNYLITRNHHDYPANYFDHIAYPGMIVWLLAGVGVAAGWRNARVRFFGATALVSLLIMYGTPGIHAVLSELPLFRVTYLARFGLVTIVASIVLAAVGVGALTQPRGNRRHRGVGLRDQHDAQDQGLCLTAAVMTAVVLGAVVLSLGWMQPVLRQSGLWGFTLRYSLLAVALAIGGLWLIVVRARRRLPVAVFIPAVLVLLLGDLVPAARSFRPMMPAQEAFPPIPEIEAIKRDPGVFRVTGYGHHLPPNSAMVYGLHDFRGYDGVGLERYQALLDVGFEAIRNEGSTVHLFDRPEPNRLLDLLNVKYVFVAPGTTLPADHYTQLDGTRAPVYRNDGAFPRAFLVDGYRVEADGTGRRVLWEGGVDLRRTVLLAKEPPAGERPEAVKEAGELGSAEVRAYGDTVVEIETSEAGRRLLVLTDVYYPGWRVTVDGRPETIHRANTAFRAVSVPPGRHLVRFEYRPWSFGLGLAVSAGAALGLLAFTFCASRRKKTLHRDPGSGLRA